MAARDLSLDLELGPDSHQTPLDKMADRAASPEEALGDLEEQSLLRGRVREAMRTLSDRERFIVEHRLMADEPQTLEEIGTHFQVSRERARQIETKVVHKIKVAFARRPTLVAA